MTVYYTVIFKLSLNCMLLWIVCYRG